MGSPEVDSEKIASDLKGNTLRVYWYVLNASGKIVGVREVQRALGFSSPTLALYHLDKLRELGLVAKDSGEYRLVKEVKVDILKQFVKVGRIFVPRFAAYATFFTGLFVYYVVFLASQGALDSLVSFFGLVFGGAGSAIFWFETVKTWRQRP
jgi:predicted DNA-binding transcriptional regulator